MMREILCHECGAVTMKIENGSMIRKGTITICQSCNKIPETDSKDSKISKNSLDDVFRMFGVTDWNKKK